MKDRIAIIDGLRSPVAKAYGKLKDVDADILGAIIAKELILRVGIDYKDYDEVIIGNVAQPANASNMARVLAIRAGFPISTPAYTVHRNCASGMQSISSAISKIYAKEGELYLVGGVESMSNIPMLLSKNLRELLQKLSQTKGFLNKLKVISSLKANYLKPEIGLVLGLTDPISGKIMGITAENLANDFEISRQEQDMFALNSHLKAEEATKKGIFREEIHPILYKDDISILDDDGIRYSQNMKALSKLRPFFDRVNGTVTAANSSQISDGATMLSICSESHAKKLGIKPLGFIKDYTYVGLEPSRMGLGPVFATNKLLSNSTISLKDIELIELNEAFAAQVIANVRAFNSKEFAKKHLNGNILGEVNEDILNVNGGAIALGHPVGMSGTRIVLHTLKELRRRKQQLGLATLCVGGGQGAAFLLEVE
jgi:acetyl-CoA acetyltransferase family protein